MPHNNGLKLAVLTARMSALWGRLKREGTAARAGTLPLHHRGPGPSRTGRSTSLPASTSSIREVRRPAIACLPA